MIAKRFLKTGSYASNNQLFIKERHLHQVHKTKTLVLKSMILSVFNGKIFYSFLKDKGFTWLLSWFKKILYFDKSLSTFWTSEE